MWDADDILMTDTTVAWQKEEMGRWSQVHRTADHGKTTLCGKTVPESFNTDGFSTQGNCKACAKAKGTK